MSYLKQKTLLSSCGMSLRHRTSSLSSTDDSAFIEAKRHVLRKMSPWRLVNLTHLLEKKILQNIKKVENYSQINRKCLYLHHACVKD